MSALWRRIRSTPGARDLAPGLDRPDLERTLQSAPGAVETSRDFAELDTRAKLQSEFVLDEVAQQLANLDVGRLLQSELGAGEVAQLAKPDIWLQLQPEFEASHVAQHFATFETWRRIHSEFSGSSVPWRSAKSHALGAKLQAQFVSGCASADFKELNFWPFVQSELSFRDASGPRQPDIWGQLQLESRDRESSTKLAAPDPGRKV